MFQNESDLGAVSCMEYEHSYQDVDFLIHIVQIFTRNCTGCVDDAESLLEFLNSAL